MPSGRLFDDDRFGGSLRPTTTPSSNLGPSSCSPRLQSWLSCGGWYGVLVWWVDIVVEAWREERRHGIRVVPIRHLQVVWWTRNQAISLREYHCAWLHPLQFFSSSPCDSARWRAAHASSQVGWWLFARKLGIIPVSGSGRYLDKRTLNKKLSCWRRMRCLVSYGRRVSQESTVGPT